MNRPMRHPLNRAIVRLGLPVAVVVSLASAQLWAQVEVVLGGLALKQPAAVSIEMLEKIADRSELIEVNPPRFPLARYRESHLIASRVVTDAGTIEQVILTFADDALVYIEAFGNAAQVFTDGRTGPPQMYMDYAAWPAERLFVNTAADRVWILTEAGVHANLFTWRNPNAHADRSSYAAKPSRRIPEFLEMGATLEDMRPLLRQACSMIREQSLDGSDPNAQLQIDCFGVEYMGFPRKIEARFGNSRLNVVWMLTGQGEEHRVRKALGEQFGDAIFSDERWEIFNQWKVGLRKDKPEVLLMAPEIGLQYKASFFGQ